MPRAEQLTPLSLLKQILLLQTIYYTIIVILVGFSCWVSGDAFHLGLIFDWHSVHYDTTIGWTISMLWLIDTVFTVLAMTVIVGRSKLALDFTVTLHVINIVVSTLYTRALPTNGLWWLIQATSTVLMTILGTWTSQWRELRKTFFEEGYEMVNRNTNQPTNPV
ncbi:Protein SYS1 [Yarrowia sp. B02]|nr:Protein SYS1 [Yarrowia sp. B02]